MPRPKWGYVVDLPEKNLSPKANAFYKTLLKSGEKGVPADMVGTDMLKELGGLVEKVDERVHINGDYIASYYANYIREKITEHPYIATGVVLNVLGQIEDNRQYYGKLAERIMLGVIAGIGEPIKTGNTEVSVTISFPKKGRKRRMQIDQSTDVPCD
jgi:hypothetical protein